MSRTMSNFMIQMPFCDTSFHVFFPPLFSFQCSRWGVSAPIPPWFLLALECIRTLHVFVPPNSCSTVAFSFWRVLSPPRLLFVTCLPLMCLCSGLFFCALPSFPQVIGPALKCPESPVLTATYCPPELDFFQLLASACFRPPVFFTPTPRSPRDPQA